MYITSGNSGLLRYPITDEKKRYGFWIILYSSKFDWDLDGRNLGSCFEGNRAWLSRGVIQFFTILARWVFYQVSVVKSQIHCLAIKYLLMSRNISIDTLMDEMQTCFGDQKVWLSSSIKNFSTLRLLGSVQFPISK